MPVRAIERRRSRLAQKLERWLRFTVDELRAELHGKGEARLVMRPDAPADAIARLDDERRAPCPCNVVRSSEPGGAGADDYDVDQGRSHVIAIVSQSAGRNGHRA